MPRTTRADTYVCSAWRGIRACAVGWFQLWWRTVVEVRDHADVPIVVWQALLDSPALLLLDLLPVPLDLSAAHRRTRTFAQRMYNGSFCLFSCRTTLLGT